MRVCYAVGAEGFSPGWRLCETLGACFTKSMFSLEGKSAVVTGGASGIGLAIVERFVAAGAEVLLVDRKEVRAMALKLGALFHQADVSKEWEIEKIAGDRLRAFWNEYPLVPPPNVQNGRWIDD